MLSFGERSKSCPGELKGRGHKPSRGGGGGLVTPGPPVIIPPETSVVQLNSKLFQGLHWEGAISKDCSPAWGRWGYWEHEPEGSCADLMPLPPTRVSSAQMVPCPNTPETSDNRPQHPAASFCAEGAVRDCPQAPGRCGAGRETRAEFSKLSSILFHYPFQPPSSAPQPTFSLIADRPVVTQGSVRSLSFSLPRTQLSLFCGFSRADFVGRSLHTVLVPYLRKNQKAES